MRTVLNCVTQLPRHHMIAVLMGDQNGVGVRHRGSVAVGPRINHQTLARSTLKPDARMSPDAQLETHGVNISRRTEGCPREPSSGRGRRRAYAQAASPDDHHQVAALELLDGADGKTVDGPADRSRDGGLHLHRLDGGDSLA